MGIVIQTTPEVLVAEALGTVHVLPLKKFDAKTQRGQRISIRRFNHPKARTYLKRNSDKFLKYYQQQFSDLLYDHDFLWNNFDSKGKEKLYCSEFVTKLLSGFLRVELPMKRMSFDKNREHWMRYFKGTPPDGKWGNSPGDFERSELFHEVGEL